MKKAKKGTAKEINEKSSTSEEGVEGIIETQEQGQNPPDDEQRPPEGSSEKSAQSVEASVAQLSDTGREAVLRSDQQTRPVSGVVKGFSSPSEVEDDYILTPTGVRLPRLQRFSAVQSQPPSSYDRKIPTAEQEDSGSEGDHSPFAAARTEGCSATVSREDRSLPRQVEPPASDIVQRYRHEIRVLCRIADLHNKYRFLLRDRIIRQEAHFDFIVETAAKLGLSDEELEEDLALALEISGKTPKGRKVEASRPHTSPTKEVEPATQASTKEEPARPQSSYRAHPQSPYDYEDDDIVDYEEYSEEDYFQDLNTKQSRPQTPDRGEATKDKVQPLHLADTQSVSSHKSSTYSTQEGESSKSKEYPFSIDKSLPTEVGVIVSPLVVTSRAELYHLICFLDDLQLKRRVARELEQRWKGRTDSNSRITAINQYQEYLNCQQSERALQISDDIDTQIQKTLGLDNEHFLTVLPVNHPKYLFKEAAQAFNNLQQRTKQGLDSKDRKSGETKLTTAKLVKGDSRLEDLIPLFPLHLEFFKKDLLEDLRTGFQTFLRIQKRPTKPLEFFPVIDRIWEEFEVCITHNILTVKTLAIRLVSSPRRTLPFFEAFTAFIGHHKFKEITWSEAAGFPRFDFPFFLGYFKIKTKFDFTSDNLSIRLPEGITEDQFVKDHSVVKDLVSLCKRQERRRRELQIPLDIDRSRDRDPFHRKRSRSSDKNIQEPSRGSSFKQSRY